MRAPKKPHDLGESVSQGQISVAHIDALRQTVRAEMTKAGLSACQFALAHEGEIVAAETLGDAPNDARFLIMSATKVLAAAVIWQFIGEGALDPSKPVATWWPEFARHDKGQVTLEHVMTHTAGLTSAHLSDAATFDRTTRLAEMEDWHLEWPPGSRYEYHGVSAHWILAELIERQTGQDFRASIRNRLLDPLGLDRLELGIPVAHQADVRRLTVVGTPPTKEAIVEFLGVPLPEQPLPATSTAPSGSFDIFAQLSRPDVLEAGVPGASAASDATSLALLYQNLLHDPKGLWDRAVLRDATGNPRNKLPDGLGRRAFRSLGLELAGDDDKAHMRIGAGATSAGTFGHGGAGGQVSWADPVSGLSFVFLTNCFDLDFVRQYRRDMAVTRAAAACIA
jgi:CubicO group peptidase (beta-lactamase class C family)